MTLNRTEGTTRMNQSRIEAYVNELFTLLTTHEDQSKTAAQLKATLSMLDATGKQENAMQAANQLAEIQQVVSVIETVIANKTKRPDTDGARRLHADIAVRMQSADKLFEEWRRIEAAYELAVALKDLEGEDRAKADAQVTKARERYEKQVELGSNLVPSTVELLRPLPVPATGALVLP